MPDWQLSGVVFMPLPPPYMLHVAWIVTPYPACLCPILSVCSYDSLSFLICHGLGDCSSILSFVTIPKQKDKWGISVVHGLGVGSSESTTIFVSTPRSRSVGCLYTSARTVAVNRNLAKTLDREESVNQCPLWVSGRAEQVKAWACILLPTLSVHALAVHMGMYLYACMLRAFSENSASHGQAVVVDCTHQL